MLNYHRSSQCGGISKPQEADFAILSNTVHARTLMVPSHLGATSEILDVAVATIFPARNRPCSLRCNAVPFRALGNLPKTCPGWVWRLSCRARTSLSQYDCTWRCYLVDRTRSSFNHCNQHSPDLMRPTTLCAPLHWGAQGLGFNIQEG